MAIADRFITLDGILHVVTSVQFGLEDTIVFAARVVDGKIDRKTRRVTQVEHEAKAVRLVNPVIETRQLTEAELRDAVRKLERLLFRRALISELLLRPRI